MLESDSESSTGYGNVFGLGAHPGRMHACMSSCQNLEIYSNTSFSIMHLKTVNLSEYCIDVIIILLSSMDPCTYETLIVTNHKN